MASAADGDVTDDQGDNGDDQTGSHCQEGTVLKGAGYVTDLSHLDKVIESDVIQTERQAVYLGQRGHQCSDDGRNFQVCRPYCRCTWFLL